MAGRAKRERPRGAESNLRRGDGRSTSDSHGGGNGGSHGYSRGSGSGGSHGHHHGHSLGPNPGPDRGLTCCDTRGNIAASSTASIVISSQPRRGVKFGVNYGRDRGRRFPFSVRRRLGRTTVRFLAGSGWSRACGWRGRQGGFWPRTRRLRVLRPDLPRP